MQVRQYLYAGVFTFLWLAFGCHALLLNPASSDKGKRVEKLDKDSPPGTPAKYNFRVSQYIFLSDFELKRDDAIFGELSDLRDRVYKELQLPNANSVVQVYIFENRERYERYMRTRYPELPK